MDLLHRWLLVWVRLQKVLELVALVELRLGPRAGLVSSLSSFARDLGQGQRVQSQAAALWVGRILRSSKGLPRKKAVQCKTLATRDQVTRPGVEVR